MIYIFYSILYGIGLVFKMSLTKFQNKFTFCLINFVLKNRSYEQPYFFYFLPYFTVWGFAG